ncbi:MAG: ferrichrome ABC transporter substrate-binding protein [Afipia sp.]|nr:ferrichrome ABC transporter substrate-binding protein [Afipia sp.]
MTSGLQLDAGFSSGRNGRRRRLSLVLALMLGLLASLFHCGNHDVAFAGSNTTVIAMDLDGSTPPDTADQKMPAHCGHCLNHVTGQATFAVSLPADISHQAPPIGREQTPPSLAGLPLFKPPRA